MKQIQRLRLVWLLGFVVLLLLPGWPAQADDAERQLEFGVKMARRGLWSEALFRFEQAERLDPSNPRILNNLAVALEATGQFDKALSQYQKALRASPNDKVLRRNYARFVEFYQNYKPEQEVEGGSENGAAEG